MRTTATFPDWLQDALQRTVAGLGSALMTSVISALIIGVVMSVVAQWSSQRCNADRPWWRNEGLATDAWFWLSMPLFTPYVRTAFLIAGATVIAWLIGDPEPGDYISNGNGIFQRIGFWPQLAIYIVLSDFLLYWSHRLFHGNQLWRYHAVHHSAKDVDWTTSYRCHPVNLWCGPVLVTTAMILLGIAPSVLAFWMPFDIFMAAFVHANLKWNLGPLKYVIATPVFHRWHHTYEACQTNYGSSLALWDVLFGTYYMPEQRLPNQYGVPGSVIPRSFLGQLAYPFREAK